jgi:hypothetical protein
VDEKELLAPAQEEVPVVVVSDPSVENKELHVLVDDEVPTPVEFDIAPVVKEKELPISGEEVADAALVVKEKTWFSLK